MPENDLKRLLEDRVRQKSTPKPPSDLGWVINRGRGMKRMRRVMQAVMLLCTVGVGVVGFALAGELASSPTNSDVSQDEGENEQALVVEDMSEGDQARIFAFRALAKNDLMGPFSERAYYMTSDTAERSGDGWQLGFAASDCSPKETPSGSTYTCRGLSGGGDLGNGGTDVFVTVVSEDNTWSIADIQGNMLPEERNRVLGFTLEQTEEPSHWEFPVVGLSSDYGQGSFALMPPLWVGPFPTQAPGSGCTVTLLDGDGNVVADRSHYFKPPRSELELSGSMFGVSFPNEDDSASVTAMCQQSPNPDKATLDYHEDTRLDLSARVPDEWNTQPFDNRVGFVTHTGFVVSNVEHTFVYPDLDGGRSTSAWDMTDLPPNGVVIEVSRVVRFEIDCNSQEGNMQVTDFPLSLDDPTVIEGRGRYGSPLRSFIGVCLANGKNFGVHAWFFPEASDRDRDLARQMISSIRSTS